MRLTLRTLLAYLDDTLEAAQAKVIGQKVSESESARELIERIKQVTRRRRLTTPPSSGPGTKIDANTIADYLDNEVTPEQAEEVEQICLSSDVHLAEVAACHQILTLVLGEPVAVPPAAHQRMYGLIKGQNTPSTRKPPAPAKNEGQPVTEGKDVDETLRLGLPALRIKDGWRNPVILVGGGVVAAALLVVAIWQSLPGGGDPDNQDQQISQANGKKKEPDKDEPDVKVPEKKTPDATGDKKVDEKKEPDKDKKEELPPPKNPTPGVDLKIPDVPFGPPNPRESIVARYSPPEAKESGILLQGGGGKSGWKSITAKSPEILTKRPLVSLPGSKIAFSTNRNIHVTMWSNAPDPWTTPGNAPFRFESAAELYTHDHFDLEVLLRRGRLILASTNKSGPALARIRFENPLSSGQQEFFDIALASQGTKIMVDYWTYFPVTEPFYKNPKLANRVGPTAQFGLMVLAGDIAVKHGDVTYNMTGPPGNAVIVWKSSDGTAGPFPLPKLPEVAPKIRPEMLKARDDLAGRLFNQEVDVVLAEMTSSQSPVSRRLAVLCQGALDDLSGLIEGLDQEKMPDVRQSAHEVLRQWISQSRDNDYRLYEALKERYKGRETDIIMEMLHYTYFSPEESRRPERYEILIDYLENNTLVIRELAHWYLINLVPAGRNIRYFASDDSTTRARAVTAWRNLIPPGQLPPKAGPPLKKG